MVTHLVHGLAIFLRGFAMGCADLVPGVSGGTIALITNIYERLITAISNLDLKALSLVLRGELRAAWAHVDGNFLVVLALGIFSAIFSLANVIAWLLENQPLLVWAFFTGLILASAIYLLKQLDVNRTLGQLGFTLAGIALVLAVNFLRADLSDPAMPLVFGAGFVAISAMLLPGISGSFILLTLGLYQPTLDAVRGFDTLYLLSFALGAATGFVVFSRLIRWLLANYHHQMLMFLVGLLLGSLQATWPWKDFGGAARPGNLMPGEYADLTGSAQLSTVVLVVLAAMLLVWSIEWLSAGREQSREAG